MDWPLGQANISQQRFTHTIYGHGTRLEVNVEITVTNSLAVVGAWLAEHDFSGAGSLTLGMTLF